ncbi:MAG: hypothetical protein KIS67_24040 [Verrucomicrobiae bacterium]|nr:hypothetical protein [Verrucomicrobiae bacterium]
MNCGQQKVILTGAIGFLGAWSFAAEPAAINRTSVDSARDRAPKALQLVGHDLFVAAWGYGIQILDVSDPAAPKWKGGWNPRRAPVGIQVVGDYAFVANQLAGLTVLDVADSANPVWLTTYDTPGSAASVHVVGKHAYVADGPGSGLLILDVSNPRQPTLVGKYEPQQHHPSSVQVVDHIAYLSCYSWFERVDVSNPSNPQPVGRCRVTMAFHSHVAGKLAYTGAQILDARDPMFVANWPGGGISVHVVNGFAYAASYGGGMRVADVREPLDAKLVTVFLPESPQYDVVVVGGRAYLMDTGASIRILDVSDPRNPTQIGSFPSSQYVSRVLAFKRPEPATGVKPPASEATQVPIVDTTAAITNAPPELSRPHTSVEGGFSFVLAGVPHATYVIQASSDLNSWTAITTNVLPATGALRITDLRAAEFSQRYYRAVKLR